MNQVNRRCDGVVRREVLRLGGLSAFGLGLGSFFRLQNVAHANLLRRTAAAKPKSCILIWLDGGPSHLETFDPKPDAPVEVRGPLRTIPTALTGVRIGECLPQTAKRMKDIAVVRSMTSTLGEHNFGTHYLLTGFKPTPVLEYPSFHSVGASVYDHVSTLPANIAVPHSRVGGGKFSGNGFLATKHKPFSIGADPSKGNFKVRDLDLYRGITLDSVKRRREFVNALDQFSNLDGGNGDAAFDQAFRLVTSKEAKAAFSIEREKSSLRKKYGLRTVGQCCLLARRLVERGVPFVTVNVGGWDTHENLKTRLKEGYTGAKNPVGLVPSLDLAFSALIDDLKERGLFDNTLVVVMGEFGRTPKLNTAGGRDHWPRVFSVALAGGGVAGGQIVGASDALGERPKDRPVTPSDLVATIYKLLGIDPALELTTPDGRPVRVTPHESKIVKELIA